jgi:hypothetical protein
MEGCNGWFWGFCFVWLAASGRHRRRALSGIIIFDEGGGWAYLELLKPSALSQWHSISSYLLRTERDGVAHTHTHTHAHTHTHTHRLAHAHSAQLTVHGTCLRTERDGVAGSAGGDAGRSPQQSVSQGEESVCVRTLRSALNKTHDSTHTHTHTHAHTHRLAHAQRVSATVLNSLCMRRWTLLFARRSRCHSHGRWWQRQPPT